MSKSYNGHKNRAHWNVSLWIGNDEMLYRLAQQRIRSASNRNEAAKELLQDMCDMQSTSEPVTPDGCRYNVTNIRAAIRGM